MPNGSLFLRKIYTILEVGLSRYYFVNNIMNCFYFDYIDTVYAIGKYININYTVSKCLVYIFRINSEEDSDLNYYL